MRQRNNSYMTQMFKGFRLVRKKIEGKVEAIPQAPKLNLTKNLFKKFEKCKVLTNLQYGIVQNQLNRCTEKDNPEYIARLCAIAEKYINNQTEENKK